MSEENKYYYWNNYGGVSEGVSCTSDIYEINPSSSFEHLDATFSNNNDLMGPSCSYDQDIGEGYLYDIFKDLSKIPHASQSFLDDSQNNNDDSHNNHHQSEESNEKLVVLESSQNNKRIKRKEADINATSMKGKQPIKLKPKPKPSHTFPCDETRKNLRLNGRKRKEANLNVPIMKGKQPIELDSELEPELEPSNTLPCDETHKILRLKRRNELEKDRRTRIIEKLKAMQAVLPPSSQTDYASILDNAIKYIKSLKLYLQMFEMARSFYQSAYQASFKPPFPTMNVQGAGGMQPWPHVPMIGGPNFPFMMLQPFMPMDFSFSASQPMNVSFSASQTISPLPQPTYTISNTQPLERSLSRATSSKRLSRSSSGNKNDELPNKAISSGS